MAVEEIEAVKAKVDQEEWRWVLIWSAVILLVTSLPYIYGALISTPASQFSGFVIGVEDGNSYLAKMRQGRVGAWHFHLPYTPEPHDEAYVIYLFYLSLGHVARLMGLPLILVYHLARIVCGFFVLVSVYRFAAFFSELRPVRQLTFWMAGVGSGLGWLLLLLGLLDRLGLPLDFYSPEAFIFHALFALPHLALAEGLLLWAILLLLLAWERRKPKHALLAGLALLGMTIIAAFYIVVAAVIIGVGWLLRWWQVRLGAARPWRAASLAILAFTIAAPVPLYNAYVFTTNPVFQMWAEQNRILSPPPVHYLLAFGLLALLAVVGVWTDWGLGLGHNLHSERRMLLIGWCAIALPLAYVPFNLQRRLTLGVQVALAFWAALGLWRLLFQNLRSGEDKTPVESRAPHRKAVPRRWRVISVGVVALLSLSNLLILVGAGMEVGRRSAPLFHSDAEITAADWLGAHTTSDQVVLAAYETGNYLPTRMSARVFAGHGPETVRSGEKIAMLRQFFAGGQRDTGFRFQFLQDYGISYVFYGPAERALGSFSPDTASYLREVYDNGVVKIYQVLDSDND